MLLALVLATHHVPATYPLRTRYLPAEHTVSLRTRRARARSHAPPFAPHTDHQTQSFAAELQATRYMRAVAHSKGAEARRLVTGYSTVYASVAVGL